MIRPRLGLQADVFRLGAEPELARLERNLLAREAAAEILVGRHVDEAGLLAIGRRRPILAAPQRRADSTRLPMTGLCAGSTIGLPVSSMPFQTSVATNGHPAT